jgi:hypothetical protein
MQQAYGVSYGLVQRHAAMLAFVDDFWLMGILFLTLIPLMFLMKKTVPHKPAAAGSEPPQGKPAVVARVAPKGSAAMCAGQEDSGQTGETAPAPPAREPGRAA